MKSLVRILLFKDIITLISSLLYVEERAISTGIQECWFLVSLLMVKQSFLYLSDHGTM